MSSKKSNLAANGKPQPPFPNGFVLPFHYSSLTNCGVFYLVDADKVEKHLEGTGLLLALFDGKAMFSFNYQLYTGQFATGCSIVQEVEVCLLTYPSSKAADIPQITADEYIRGYDQTKLFGNLRLFVPCDSPLAIKAGIELYGEPKFQTTFNINLPSHNSNPMGTNWEFTVNDPKDDKAFIMKCAIETSRLTPFKANFSPITEYGTHNDKLIACRWDILQPMDTYFFDDDQSRVSLSFGKSSHLMKSTIENIVGDAKPIAARTYLSPSAAINSRAYYP